MSGPHGPTDPTDPDERWAYRGPQSDQGPSAAWSSQGQPAPAVDATQMLGPQQQDQPGHRPPSQAWSQQPYGYPAPGPQSWAPQPSWPRQQPPGPQWGPPYGAPQGYPHYQQGGYQGPSAPWIPPGPPGRTGKSKAPWFIGIGAAALIVIGAVVIGSVLSTDTLDQRAAQAGVVKVLTESYGAQNVTNVSCPSGQKVQKGNSFTCTLDVDGTRKVVTLTFTDDAGTYEVGRPS